MYRFQTEWLIESYFLGVPKNWWIDLISWQINFAGLHARLKSVEAMISWFLSIRHRNQKTKKKRKEKKTETGKRSGEKKWKNWRTHAHLREKSWLNQLKKAFSHGEGEERDGQTERQDAVPEDCCCFVPPRVTQLPSRSRAALKLCICIWEGGILHKMEFLFFGSVSVCFPYRVCRGHNRASLCSHCHLIATLI